MKKCPYCSEEIQTEAIKCRYCHTILSADISPPIPEQSNNRRLENDENKRSSSSSGSKGRAIMGILIAVAGLFLGRYITNLYPHILSVDENNSANPTSPLITDVVKILNIENEPELQRYVFWGFTSYILWSLYWGVQIIGSPIQRWYSGVSVYSSRGILHLLETSVVQGFIIYFIVIPILGLIIGVLGGAIIMQIKHTLF